MRLRRVCDKPLRSACVLARKSHSHCCPIVKNLVDLATDLVSRSAVAVASRVTILNHKVRHDPVNGDVAKIAALGELDEIIYCQWGCVREQVNSKRTLAGSHYGSDRLADPTEGALVIRIGIPRLYRSDLGREAAGAVSL